MDLLIENGGQIHPVEIKRNSNIENTRFRGFGFLEELDLPIGHGCILNLGADFLPYDEKTHIVPVGYL